MKSPVFRHSSATKSPEFCWCYAPCVRHLRHLFATLNKPGTENTDRDALQASGFVSMKEDLDVTLFVGHDFRYFVLISAFRERRRTGVRTLSKSLCLDSIM